MEPLDKGLDLELVKVAPSGEESGELVLVLPV